MWFEKTVGWLFILTSLKDYAQGWNLVVLDQAFCYILPWGNLNPITLIINKTRSKMGKE